MLKWVFLVWILIVNDVNSDEGDPEFVMHVRFIA